MDKRKECYYRLSEGQVNIMLMEKVYPGTSIGWLTHSYKMETDIDMEHLNNAINQFIKYNDSIRIRIREENGNWFQYVGEYEYCNIEQYDFSDNEEVYNEFISKMASRLMMHYDKELYELFLVVFPDNRKGFICNIHHGISDAQSTILIGNGIRNLYRTATGAQEEVIEKVYSYIDCLKYMENYKNSEQYGQDKKFWDKMRDSYAHIKYFNKQQTKYTVLAKRKTYNLNDEIVERLRSFGLNHKLSLVTIMESALFFYLYTKTGKDSITVGTHFLNRDYNRNCENMLGMFVSTTPLVLSNISANLTVNDFIEKLRKNISEVRKHVSYPYADLTESLKKKTEGGNLLEVIFNYRKYDLDYDMRWHYCGNQVFPLIILVEEYVRNGTFSLSFDYKLDEFSETDIQLIFEHYMLILDKLITNNQQIGMIDLLTQNDRERLNNKINNTQIAYNKNITIHKLIEQQAALRGERIALTYHDRNLTNRELGQKANILANQLKRAGIQNNEPIAVMVERSPEMIISMVAVLKAGGVYVPVDIDFPQDRIQYMLEDSKVNVILATKKTKDEFGEIIKNKKIIDVNMITPLDRMDENDLTETVQSSDNAYIIYTSGSTGRPKGVVITHRNVVNFISGMKNSTTIEEAENILGVTTISFDIFVLESLLALAVGIRIVLAGEIEQKDPYLLRDYIASNKVEAIQCTPSRVSMLLKVDKGLECFQNVKLLMIGGDAFPEHLLHTLKSVYKGHIYNMYGPSETSIWSTVKRLDQSDEITVGKPIDNTSVYIVENNRLVPFGEEGELWIGGDGVGCGYFGKEELTQDRFIRNPFGEGIVYKTGDIAKINQYDEIEILGRVDFQVKVRGYRIELEEIEGCINRVSGVHQAVVLCGKNKESSENILIACLECEESVRKDKISERLKNDLPDYMIPSKYIILSKFPLTLNGKIDRNILTNLIKEEREEREEQEDMTEMELKVHGYWCSILGISAVSLEESFFNMGGNSFLLVDLFQKIDADFPNVIVINDLFEYYTIRTMADYLDKNKETKSVETKQFEPVSDFTCRQQIEDEIVIVGMACTFPDANDYNRFWENICNFRNSIKDIPTIRKEDVKAYLESKGLNTSDFKYKIAGYLDRIDCFDSDYFNLSPKEAMLMDPAQRLLLENFAHTVEDAGYTKKELEGSKTGVFIGYSSDFGTEYKRLITQEQSLEGFGAVGNIHSVLYGRISYLYDLKGPGMVIDTACSSFLSALQTACHNIRLGLCEQAFVGSIKLTLPFGTEEEINLGVESPKGRCRPFDNQADGIANGEGVGGIFIKPLKKAWKHRDNIHAIIKGGALNQDGRTMSLTAPSAIAQSELMIEACQNAGIGMETIGHIEAHGTGTKLGDPIEINGLNLAFLNSTQKKQFVALGSVKSNIGHLDNSAGVASVIKSVMALKNKKLPPSICFEYPNSNIDFFDSPIYINTKLRDWMRKDTPRRCAVSSFSMSGTNGNVILEEYSGEEKRKKDSQNQLHIYTVSARQEDLLIQLLKNYHEFLQDNNDLSEDDFCYSANVGKNHHEVRLSIIFQSFDELKEKIMGIIETQPKTDKENGIYYGIHKIDYNKRIDDKYKLTSSLKKSYDAEVDEIIKKGRSDCNVANLLADLYSKGADINWEERYKSLEVKRISLPLYPFRKTRFWIPLTKKETVIEAPANLSNCKSELSETVLKGRDTDCYSKHEMIIGSIWRQLLGLEEVNIFDKFTDFGGNSLLAIRFEFEMKNLGYQITYEDLVEHDTIEKIGFLAEKKEEEQKLLLTNKLEPFNDVYFKDCFYNSLFPVVSYLNRDIFTFLINDTCIYKYDEKSNILNYNYMERLPLEQLFLKENLMLETTNKSKHITLEIEQALEQNRFIIVFVDCYYESIRKDTYHRLHWPHTLLIYGCNKANKEFFAIEHKNKDNLDYRHEIISYDDVEKSYQGYLEQFLHEKPDASVYKIVNQKQSEKNCRDYKNMLMEQRMYYKDQIEQGMSDLLTYAKAYDILLVNKIQFMGNINKMTELLNHIINLYKVESYILDDIKELGQIKMKVEQILKIWESIRKVFVVCLYSNSYREAELIECKGQIKKIYQLECEKNLLYLSSNEYK